MRARSQESGVRRKKKEEGRRKKEIGHRIYAVIFDENTRVLNIYSQ
jgi:hypothetical protein